jgi:hypothetical protein
MLKNLSLRGGNNMYNKMKKMIGTIYIKNKDVIFTTIIIGFLTYGFMITNKLPNHDDIHYFMGKDEILTLGRWGG